jgi:hypothetical protein
MEGGRTAAGTRSDLSSGRGHPALELVRDDGTTLGIGTDSQRAYLVWTTRSATVFTGWAAAGGGVLVYDYFGSWSEAPAGQLVSLADAIDCGTQFLRHGMPDTAAVIFTPD